MNPASSSPPSGAPYTVVGRYAIFDEIASGGMATVHLGRLLGAAGFSRTVAIKRLHPQFSRDAEFAAMFMDEAHLASRINHPNVVQTIDVVPEGKDILLVMEYVHGVPFAQLLGTARRTGWRVPARIVAGVMVGALEGLHAAHEARSETGQPLQLVHRDVSPQNVLVGAEGVPRVIDFGVAKAMGKMHATREGQLKGKLAYMSPEQVRGVDVTRLSDIFSAGIVVWEALMAERLFDGKNPAELIMQVLSAPIRPPREKFPDLPEALDAVVMKALDRDPARRFATAREMAVALEAAAGAAHAREIAEWVEAMSGSALTQRAHLLESIERAMAGGDPARLEALRRPSNEAPRTSESGAIRLGAEPNLGLESGPRARPEPMPIAGAMRADVAYDDTLAQKLRSERPPAVAQKPRSDRPPAPRPAEPSNDAAALPPSSPLAGALGQKPRPLDDKLAPAAPHRPRPIPIPVREPDDSATRSALAARLAWPLRVVGAGVVLSLVDFAIRQIGLTLPFRPLWAAEALVVVGVIWAFVGVFLSSREE